MSLGHRSRSPVLCFKTALKGAIIWPTVSMSSQRQKGSQKSLPFSAFVILTQTRRKVKVCRTLYIDSRGCV